MKKLLKGLLSMSLLLNVVGCSKSTSSEGSSSTKAADAADVIYTNGEFYTEDENTDGATAMAVKDGTIVYIGDEDSDELEAFKGDATEIVDLNGAFVTPNIIDAHSHPSIVCTTAWYVDIPDDCVTQETILNFVKEYCDEHPVEEQPYIYFEYYPSDLFDENGPQKEWIDEVVSDRAILIEDFSDHACWVNTKFLEDIGAYDEGVISEDDQQFMVKDASGDYTGWIKEFVWQNYIDNLYEKLDYYPPEEVTEETITPVLDDFKSWGVTSIMDACEIGDDDVATISQMDKEGKLNMYYEFCSRMYEFDDLEDTIDRVHYLDETYGTDHVSIDTIKIFYDGTNELGDAALVDGWVTDSSQTGYLLLDLDQTITVIKRCNEEGIDVHFHMVGDLAFRQVCDAVEAIQDEGINLDIQVEMCHCEYINPEDYERPAELGIIVNWTPHWSGGYFGEASLQYLGEERYNSMYQFNPLIESGAIVTFGSDIYSMYEENRGNPYFGMQTAMTRVDIEYPLECGMRESADAILSLTDLLKGYTINAAVQMRIDDKTGSLTVGKGANFNVYEESLFDVDVNEFKDVMPKAVYFEGNCISGSLS